MQMHSVYGQRPIPVINAEPTEKLLQNHYEKP